MNQDPQRVKVRATRTADGILIEVRAASHLVQMLKGVSLEGTSEFSTLAGSWARALQAALDKDPPAQRADNPVIPRGSDTRPMQCAPVVVAANY
jgi:hypothetical protein